MKLVINELSFSRVQSEGEASNLYNGFFEACLYLERRYKVKLSLLFSQSPNNNPLNEGLPFQRWLANRKDKEEIRSILSMLTNNPIIQDYPYYYLDNVEAIGLGYAFEQDEVSISFLTDPIWNYHFISLNQ